MIRECGRWYLVEYVTIEIVFTWPCSHERVAAWQGQQST